MDIRLEKVLRKVINEIEGTENVERREFEWKSYQIYSGAQRAFILKQLAAMYPESHNAMLASNINILKKVTDKRSCVYKNKPIRLVNGEPNDNLDKIYKKGKFNRSFMGIETIFNRSRHSLAWVQNDPDDLEKFRLVPLQPFSYDLVIDPDTFEVLAVILSYPGTDITDQGQPTRSDSQNQVIAESQNDSAAATKTYPIWTKDFQVNVVVSKQQDTTQITYMIDKENNPEQENPLGMLPFVWLTDQPMVPEYPIENPLVDESINANILGSTILTAANNQIGQMVLMYPEGSKLKEVHTGFKIALELPQSTKPQFPKTEMKYEVPNSDLPGMRDTLNEYVSSLMSDNGLEGATMTGKTEKFASGIERIIASASITDVKTKNKETFGDGEEGVFEVVKAYDRVNDTSLFSEEDVLTVAYTDQKIITSDMEKLNIIAKKDELGIIEEVEKVMLDNPGMTETQAIEKLKRIKLEKAKIISDQRKALEGNNIDDDEDKKE